MHKIVAIGGTFDRFHKGHESFVKGAFLSGEKVIIGLTSDEMAGKKSKIPVAGFDKRKAELIKFLEKKGLLKRTEILQINDLYGPALEKNKIEAIVLTGETIKGGREINRKRRKLGLKPLKLIRLPLILAGDRKRIASTRIRHGEIDRTGLLFHKTGINGKTIPSGLRLKLKEPQGKLIAGDPENPRKLSAEVVNLVKTTRPVMIITVGDEVTKLLNEIGLKPELAIIDFRVNRYKKYSKYSDVGLNVKAGENAIAVVNTPGKISRTLSASVKNAYKMILLDGKQRVIRVIGEEDLAALSAMLSAPLNSLLFYGQPGKGVVAVYVTEEMKEALLKLLSRYG